MVVCLFITIETYFALSNSPFWKVNTPVRCDIYDDDNKDNIKYHERIGPLYPVLSNSKLLPLLTCLRQSLVADFHP